MNVNLQTITGTETDIDKTVRSMDAGMTNSINVIKGSSLKNAVAVTFNDGINNQAYIEPGKTKNDVMAEAQNTDAQIRHNYMNLLANNMSPEDFNKAAEGGFDLSDMNPKEAVTILDKIKATLAMSGEKIIGYTDDISIEKLTAITGNKGLANDIISSFEENDLPLSEENVSEVMTSIKNMADITKISDGAVKYMTLNELKPTMENIYKSEHVTNGQDRTGGLFIALETQGYYAQKANTLDWNTVKDQAEKIIIEAGYEPTDTETLNNAKWMIEDAIPLTIENLNKVNELKELKFPMKESDIVNSVAKSIANKNNGFSGLIENQENNLEKAIKIAQKVDHISTMSIEEVISKKQTINIDNLDKAQKLIDSKENANELSGQGTISKDPQIEKEVLIARKQLEEIRLTMTVNANLRLISKGFSLETKPISDVIDALNAEIESIGKELFTGQEGLKYQLFEETTDKVDKLRNFPAALIGQIKNIQETNLDKIYEAGKSMQLKYEKAEKIYETVGTEVRSDLGDNIKKAFRNIDDLLKAAQVGITEQNRRAVRILAYNRMEISEENIERVRTADEKLLNVINKLKPGAVLNMIRDGHNPLKMNLEELGSELSRQDKDSSRQEEKYSKFLYKLERNAEITPEERESYIGIYRLFHTLKNTDNAAIGTVLELGSEMTIENLLVATRTVRTSKKGLDYKIDDEFGGIEGGNTKSRSISSQIETAFRFYSEKADIVYDNLEPDKLHNVQANDEMLLDELADKLKETKESEEGKKLDADYTNERMENIRKTAASQITGETSIELEKYGIEANIENVQAYLNLKAGRKGRDISVWDHAEKIAKLAFKETRQKMLEDLIEEEDYESAYEEELSRLSAELDTILAYESDSYIDVRTIHLMQKQLSVAAGMARQNSFEIPVEIEGKVIAMHVTFMDSNKEGKKVEAELETQDYGHISMAMTIDNSQLKGAFAANFERTAELEEYMENVRNSFIKGVIENEPSLNVNSKDIGIFYRRQEAGSAVAGSENGVFENRTLLRMAEIFVHVV